MCTRMHATTYSRLSQALRDAHSMANAAEAHGTLTGALCATVGYRFEDWLNEILPDGQAQPESTATLEEIFRETAEALAGRNMEFQLLLPEDDEPIAERAAALGEWCVGFLYGLGASALADPRQLPGEVGEIVRDLTEISRVGVDRTASEESNESAYAELVEFVRVGVQLVFEELEPLRQPIERSSGTLH